MAKYSSTITVTTDAGVSEILSTKHSNSAYKLHAKQLDWGVRLLGRDLHFGHVIGVSVHTFSSQDSVDGYIQKFDQVSSRTETCLQWQHVFNGRA